MKMDFNISNIEKGRKIVVNPLYGGGYEFSNRPDHNLDITDGSSSRGFWIMMIVLFLMFWRVAAGDPTPQNEPSMEQVRHEKTSKRPTQRF
jgi:hypothetical protein